MLWAVHGVVAVCDERLFQLVHGLMPLRAVKARFDFPLYYISPWGHILSLRSGGKNRGRRWAWMSQRVHPRSGHRRVTLKDARGEQHTVDVHVLVAQTWMVSPPEGENWMACHRDGNPANNSMLNLYWGTAEDNAIDREMHKARVAESAGEDCPYVPDEDLEF